MRPDAGQAFVVKIRENSFMTSPLFAPGLYVAATPIGHLGDVTHRVCQALAHCDLLYAEDTRRAQQLLAGLQVSRAKSTLRSLHAHNERAEAAGILEEIAQGKSVLLISDAGTPAISDPGHGVVAAAWQAGLPVSPLPGASAVMAAVSVCGFARWPVSFWGFAPAKGQSRKTWLAKVKRHGGLAVLFEAPHRAQESLQDCADIFGPSTQMLYARELTKSHETLLRGSIGQVQEQISALKEKDPGSGKGEMAWVFDLEETTERSESEATLQQWAAALAKEMPASNAAKCLAKMLGVSRETAYAALLREIK
jgi:16S rRNA (cytidine1402-2'-O)-methyltransferase